MAAYAGCERLVIVAEERERKKFRDVQSAVCEACGYATVALNRETYRVNALGFFAGKVPALTMEAEMLCFGQNDSEDEISAAIYEYCGEDIAKVV